MTAFYRSANAVIYRRRARGCMAQSGQMKTAEARAVFADLAAHWTKLADKAEQDDLWPVSDMPETTILIARSRKREH